MIRLALVLTFMSASAAGWAQVKAPPQPKKIPALEGLKNDASLGEAAKDAPLGTAKQAGSVIFDKADGSKDTKLPVQAPDKSMGKQQGGIIVEDEPQQDDEDGGPADQLKKMLLELMKDPKFNKDVDQFITKKVDVAKDHALSDPRVQKIQNGLDNVAVKGIVMGIGLLAAVLGFALGAPIVGAIGAGLFAGVALVTGISWLMK